MLLFARSYKSAAQGYRGLSGLDPVETPWKRQEGLLSGYEYEAGPHHAVNQAVLPQLNDPYLVLAYNRRCWEFQAHIYSVSLSTVATRTMLQGKSTQHT